MHHAKTVGVTDKLGLLSGVALSEFPPQPVIFAMAGNSLEDLQERSAEILARRDEILALDEASDEEIEELDALATEAESVGRKIAALSKFEALKSQGQGRKTAAEPKDRANAAASPRGAKVEPQAKRNDPRGGYNSFGEFAMTVRRGVCGDSDAMARLQNAATTYGNESVGADGGFAVPEEYRREIWTKVMGEDNLLTRTTPLVTGSNNLTIPKDETTPWQTSGGIQVYWENEGGTKTQSKPALEAMSMRLNKLIALVPMTDELLEDAPGMESWLRAKTPQKMASKINTAIIEGTGVGQPLGILNAPSLITVAKETSQAADTIVFANINKMYSRMYAPSRRNGIWIINQDIEPQLNAMSFPGTGTAVPVYLPPGGLSAAPYGTLMGRPVVPVEAAKTLGDLGDIIFVDLSQYYSLTKAGQGGIKTDTSIHCYFEQDITAFRFVFRVAGQPAWGSAITPQNGNVTRSWAVTLAERS